jgi:hypothetical protein
MTWEAWRARCKQMPPGHWHCEHGHVRDCPSPTTCPQINERHERRYHVVQAGPTVWVFSSPTLAEAQVNVLMHGGAKVRFYQNATGEQVQILLDELPEWGRTVEDCR